MLLVWILSTCELGIGCHYRGDGGGGVNHHRGEI